MSFSFSTSLDDAVSRVRQLLGDTVDAGHLVEDETLTAYLATRSELACAAQLARDISARFARQIDSDVDGQSQKASQLYKSFANLAEQLAKQALAEIVETTSSGGSFAGIGVYGATAQEVVDARADEGAAANAPLRWAP